MKKLLLLFLLPFAGIAAAFAGPTQLTWYGHPAFKITTRAGKIILIDPWLTNPLNKNGKEDIAELGKVDLILVTHGHFDHVGDAVEIGKRTHAKLVSTFDLGNAIVQTLGYPKELATMETQGNFGGELTLLDGEVKIAFIPAVHSSAVSAEQKEAAQSPPAPINSIAVLPIANLSDDSANGHFADAIQDAIRTQLAQNADFKVVSRIFTERDKAGPTNLSEIAEQLGVANILEGSVQKAADRVLISVQLIDARSNSHLWAENYDRELTDVFKLESEVASAAVQSIKNSLRDREQPAATQASSAQAHFGGNPGGFLVSVRGGPVIYHTGDTDLFSDMAPVSRFRKVDIMLACIGDHFTMGPSRAAEAVKLVNPTVVIPMHFGTFPALDGTAEAFRENLQAQKAKAQLKVMTVGQTMELPRATPVD